MHSTYLALSNGLENGVLNPVRILVQSHMLQHHHGAEQQSSGVSKALARNIGSRTVHSLEDGALVTDISGRSKTETTDQTSAHIGQDISVKVGHDEDLVVVGERIRDHLQASVVQQLRIELDIGVVLGDLTGCAQEKTVGHLHDGGLVHGADLLAANGLCVLECEAEDALGSLAGDELDALDDTINNDVLNTRVFTLGVLTDQNSVDVVVGGLEASNGPARPDVGEEVEGSAQSQVQRDVALSNRCLKLLIELWVLG